MAKHPHRLKREAAVASSEDDTIEFFNSLLCRVPTDVVVFHLTLVLTLTQSNDVKHREIQKAAILLT